MEHPPTGCLSQSGDRVCQPSASRGAARAACGTRLGIAVIGQGAAAHDEPLFRKLRAHGGYFSQVNPEHGLETLLNAVAARAKAHPAPYAHWYIDGGEEAAHDPALTCVSYKALEPVRAILLRKMHGEIQKPGMGPEALRTLLAQMRPADLGMGNSIRETRCWIAFRSSS